VEQLFAEAGRHQFQCNSLMIEELITPMVYKQLLLTQGSIDITRAAIEKACHIFKQSLVGKQITGLQLKTFFKSTLDYLKALRSCPESKLQRELDLEWQTLQKEVSVD
jgi:hypothetical protein